MVETQAAPERAAVAVERAIEVALDPNNARALCEFEAGQRVDCPASSIIELTLKGGRGGILVVTNDGTLCQGRHIADVEIDGQNGKRADQAVRVRTPC